MNKLSVNIYKLSGECSDCSNWKVGDLPTVPSIYYISQQISYHFAWEPEKKYYVLLSYNRKNEDWHNDT